MYPDIGLAGGACGGYGLLLDIREVAHPVRIDAAAERLAHVSLMQGYKVYGAHLGPFETPAREDDPPHMPPEFNVDQQAFLETRAVGAGWTCRSWTCGRGR